jgi:hypothetical protein
MLSNFWDLELNKLILDLAEKMCSCRASIGKESSAEVVEEKVPEEELVDEDMLGQPELKENSCVDFILKGMIGKRQVYEVEKRYILNVLQLYRKIVDFSEEETPMFDVLHISTLRLINLTYRSYLFTETAKLIVDLMKEVGRDKVISNKELKYSEYFGDDPSKPLSEEEQMVVDIYIQFQVGNPNSYIFSRKNVYEMLFRRGGYSQIDFLQKTNISVSCLFGHYPSSNLIKFTTFQRLVLSPSSGDKRGRAKGGGDPSWWAP